MAPTLKDRLLHFEQRQLYQNDEYGAEVLCRARQRIEQLEDAIKRALEDAESGEGWGPDVTVCAYLKVALKGVTHDTTN